jgi:hypothetical protein
MLPRGDKKRARNLLYVDEADERGQILALGTNRIPLLFGQSDELESIHCAGLMSYDRCQPIAQNGTEFDFFSDPHGMSSGCGQSAFADLEGHCIARVRMLAPDFDRGTVAVPCVPSLVRRRVFSMARRVVLFRIWQGGFHAFGPLVPSSLSSIGKALRLFILSSVQPGFRALPAVLQILSRQNCRMPSETKNLVECDPHYVAVKRRACCASCSEVVALSSKWEQQATQNTTKKGGLTVGVGRESTGFKFYGSSEKARASKVWEAGSGETRPRCDVSH